MSKKGEISSEIWCVGDISNDRRAGHTTGLMTAAGGQPGNTGHTTLCQTEGRCQQTGHIR